MTGAATRAGGALDPEPAVRAPEAPAPAISPPTPAIGASHQHAWALMRFELVDDRPVVRQTCEQCGEVRGYRAWERYWTPGEREIRR